MSASFLRLAALAAGIAVVGCSSTTLSESQCKANDWYTVGYSDGSRGFDQSRLLQHDDACMAHGVTPDRAQYSAGWHDGIDHYCTPENGFDLGQSGDTYRRICPTNLEEPFHAAYTNGHTLYVASSDVAEVENAIDQRTARIDELQNEMRQSVDGLIAPTTAPTDRVWLLERTKNLSEEQGRLQAEIERLNAELVVKRNNLEALRHTLAYSN
jgi:hypothetical protein